MNNIILNSQHGLHKSEKSVTITIYQLTYYCKKMGEGVNITLGKGMYIYKITAYDDLQTISNDASVLRILPKIILQFKMLKL